MLLIILFDFSDVLRLKCSALMRHLLSIRKLLQNVALIPESFTDELISAYIQALFLECVDNVSEHRPHTDNHNPYCAPYQCFCFILDEEQILWLKQ